MTLRSLICLFAVATMLLNTACTTTSHYAGHEHETLQQSIKPGDRVRITELDGNEYELLVDSVTPASFVGERAYLGPVEVRFSEIMHVEQTKSAPAKTAGAIVGGTVLAVVAGAVIVAAAMSGDLAPTY